MVGDKGAVNNGVTVYSSVSAYPCAGVRRTVFVPVLSCFDSNELRTLALTPRRTLFELLCESRMNVSDLEVPPPQQVQRVSTEASDKDAEVRTLQFAWRLRALIHP